MLLRSLRMAVLCLSGIAAPAAPTAADTSGFESLFDGRTLDGWLGQDMSFWSVEDGAISGTITPEHAPKLNQYLVWQGGLLDDFELRLTFRLRATNSPAVNGGFQFRSRRLPNGDVAGYQVDNNYRTPWKARLYDEFGRHDLALFGERTVLEADGAKHTEPLALEPGAGDFALEEWHEYHLVARGQDLSLRVNGKLIAEVRDDDPDSFESVGMLALQLHTGPPMKAQFKDIRLKRLAPMRPPTAREKLLAQAALAWQLGERLNAHQPPLKAVGTIVPGLPAEGLDARPRVKIARLEKACFDLQTDLNQPKLWNVNGHALTLYLRVRIPDGSWNSALFSKRGNHDVVNFCLFSTDLDGTPGPDIGFEVHTENGFTMTSFPVSRVDATGWLDLVGRYDGARLQIFCNGRLMAERPCSGALTQNAEAILIGAETYDGTPKRFFTGEMEEAALWSRALTDEELGVLVKR